MANVGISAIVGTGLAYSGGKINATGVGTTGPTGATGPTGPAGPAGATGSAGPAGSGSTAPAPTTRVVTATGPVTILASDAGGSVFINKTASEATTVTLLAGVPVTILDGKGDAATNNITVVPPSGGTIIGQPSRVIAGNYGAARFEPVLNSSNFGVA